MWPGRRRVRPSPVRTKRSAGEPTTLRARCASAPIARTPRAASTSTNSAAATTPPVAQLVGRRLLVVVVLGAVAHKFGWVVINEN